MSYITATAARKILGVHPNTLRNWATAGKIPFQRSAGGQRMYDISGFVGKTHARKKKIIYARVTRNDQSDDLQRQIKRLSHGRRDHEVISDVNSGAVFWRDGFKRVLELAMDKKLDEVVVESAGRFSQFEFDLVRWIVERNGGRIVVMGE